MAEQNHLYLVDGSSYIFRAYHRLPPLTNRHGVPAAAVYGYTAMLWKLADGLNKADGPTHMAVILDASESTHRNQMYDQYKANRPAPPSRRRRRPAARRSLRRPTRTPAIHTGSALIGCSTSSAKAAWAPSGSPRTTTSNAGSPSR